MKCSETIRNAMTSEIKRARQLLSQGLHDPTVMETLEALNQSLKIVTNFETKLIDDLDVD